MAAYKKENDPTNPDAIPLYNDNILKFWHWFDRAWGCGDWMNWHVSMKKKYGKQKADATFLTYWDDLATGSHAIDCRSFNEAFRNYMKSEKLLDALYSGLGIIAKPLGVGTDVVSSAASGISNLAKGVEGATKVLKVAIPVLLMGAIIYGGYWVIKNHSK